MLICPPSGLYPPFSAPLMSRGKPFESPGGLFPLHHPQHPASHLNPLFSHHLQHLQPPLHTNPYFALPNPFLQPSAGQKASPILGLKTSTGPAPAYSQLQISPGQASPDKKTTSRSPTPHTPHNLSILNTSQLSAKSKDMELDILDSSSKDLRPSSTGAMSSGSVDEELEDESMGEAGEDEDDIAEAEDLSLKSPTKSEATNSSSSNQSPASNSLIGELMSKFGFNDIQEYQVSWSPPYPHPGHSSISFRRRTGRPCRRTETPVSRRMSTTTSESSKLGWEARWGPWWGAGRGWWPGSRRTSSLVSGCRESRTAWRALSTSGAGGELGEDGGRPWRTFLCLPFLLGSSCPRWSRVQSKLWPRKADWTLYLTLPPVRSWLDVVVKTLASTVGRFSRTVPTWQSTGDLTRERSLTSVSCVPTPVPRAASSPGTWRPTVGLGRTSWSAGSATCRSVSRALWRSTWGNAPQLTNPSLPSAPRRSWPGSGAGSLCPPVSWPASTPSPTSTPPWRTSWTQRRKSDWCHRTFAFFAFLVIFIFSVNHLAAQL